MGKSAQMAAVRSRAIGIWPARIKAIALSLAVVAGTAEAVEAQTWSLYDSGQVSYRIPKSNAGSDEYFFDLKITTNGGTTQSHTSQRLSMEMDTGSTGIVISADQITDDVSSLKGDPGWAFYNSSGLLVTGILTEATVTYVDPATGKTITDATVKVLAVTQKDCLNYGSNPCHKDGGIALMGVGFGRNTLGTGPVDTSASGVVDTLLSAPTTSQEFNPLVNIVAPTGMTLNQGYIIKDGDVEVGLTASNTQRFAFGKLEADASAGETAWEQAAMSVTVTGSGSTVGPQSGILLADTGVTDSFIHVPGQPSGQVAHNSVVTVQVLDAGDNVSYSYVVACSGSGCSPQTPTDVTWVGPSATDRGVGYVNTGIRFYNGFSYLFDAENGYVGVADSGRANTQIVVTPIISAIGQITFDTPFTTDMPVYLRSSSTNPAAIATATTATFQDAFTGPGDLVINGTGTVTLNGTNTYSGQTTIQSGTLAVTNALASPVTVNGGGTFNLSGNLFVPGSSSAVVTVDPGGSFDLSGAVTGAVTNNGSTNVKTTGMISGDVETSGTFVNNGAVTGTLTTTGRVSGTGTIGHLVVGEGGTLATGNSIGTMTVTGNYLFGPGATREIEVGADGSIDLLLVGGTADLAGGTLDVIENQDLIPILGTRYVFLSAAGGITGTHDTLLGGLFPDALYPFLTTGIDYGATEAALVVTRSGVSYADAGATPNQKAVGAALDTFVNGTALDLPLTHLTADQYDLAADQLSGQIYASALTTLQNDATVVRDTIQARLGAAFEEMAGSPMFAANGAAGTPLPGLTASAWLTGYGNWGKTDASANTAELTTSLAGTLVGLDASVHEWGRIGLAAGYGSSRFKSADLASSGTAGSTTVAAYGGARMGLVRASFGAAWSWHDLNTDRTISFPGYAASEEADYSATTGQVFGEGAVDLGFAPVDMEAFAGLAFVQTSTASFSEGSDLTALSGDGDTQSNTLTTLGLRLAKAFPVAGGVLRPHATVGWQHAFGDVDPQATLTFSQSGAGFTVTGAPIARDAAVLGAGLDFTVARRATLSLGYTGRVGSDTAEHSANGVFSLIF